MGLGMAGQAEPQLKESPTATKRGKEQFFFRGKAIFLANGLCTAIFEALKTQVSGGCQAPWP